LHGFAVSGSAVAIGLKRVADGKWGFEWIDGTNVTEGFTFWADKEPNSDAENCVLMTGLEKGRWKDYTCNGPMQYICQRQIGKSKKNDTMFTYI